MTTVIELTDVHRVFPGPPEVAALRGVTLAADRGDYVAITGPSGAGKSTLLNILGLLDRPTTGSYRLAGVDIASLNDRQLAGVRASRLGFVFQAFHLMPHRTVLENVMLAGAFSGVARAERRGRADRSLAAVGLLDRRDATPRTLSGGESQRVALARALANEPDLLLCDEPTGNLDSGNTDNVLSLLHQLHEAGQTIMVITHSERVAAAAQRQVSIRDGIVVA